MKQFTKSVLETALNEEMTEHLGHEKHQAPENRDSTSSLKLNASPDGKNGAQTCSAIPMDASLAALGLGLLALARRRRS